MIRRIIFCFVCSAILQIALPVWALTPQISAGSWGSFAILDANGGIWTTGNSNAGTRSMQPARTQGFSDMKSIAMGLVTFWVIRSDDSLWGTGANNYGELGTGNPGANFTSQPVKVLDAVKHVVESGSSTYAIRTDGSLWAWGRNEQGQLGLGDRTNRSVSTKVPGLSNVLQVAAGWSTHALALTADSKVWAMGNNCCGQLGLLIPGLSPDDPRFYQTTPQMISGIDNVVAIAAANATTFMLRSDGTLWASGNNFGGQLGLGEVASTVGTPRQVTVLNGVVSVATIGGFSMALLRDGTVWGWGANPSGQLGGLGRTNESAPLQLSFLSEVTAIAAGNGTSGGGAGFALRRDGSIVTWGENKDQWLGRASIDWVLPPGAMAGPGGAGVFNAYAAAPATINQQPFLNVKFDVSGDQAPVTVNMTVTSGDNDGTVASVRLVASDGQTASINGASGTATFRFTSLGTYSIDGIAVDNQGGAAASPRMNVIVKSGAGAIDARAQIRAGFNSPIVLNSRGEVRDWGTSNSLGDSLWPQYAPNPPPEFVTHAYDPRIGSVVSIESSPSGKFVVLQSGQVLAWGNNALGALGLGSGTWVFTPALVPVLSGIVQMAGGVAHSLALDAQGRVYATGANDFGQLGFGDQLARTKFTLLQTPANVTQIAAGWWTSYALDSSGKVWAWGRNDAGQIGSGNTTDSPSPQVVVGLPPIATLFSGPGGSFAIDRDGAVWGWGATNLTDAKGVPYPVTKPIRQSGLDGAIKISTYYDSAMLKADGTVWTWGYVDNTAVLGDGTRASRTIPAKVPGLTGIADISMSSTFVLALRSDGTVLSWGENYNGQLGDGTFARRLTPVAVVNETADGFLNLYPGTSFEVPPNIGVPFFVDAVGSLAASNASVSTKTKFNAPDVGKSGAVFVTAAVPPGTLGATQTTTTARSVSRTSARAASSTPAFTLIQLTPSGWQPVVNGQLIAYASGVLGDQLAAQTILNNTDTTNLKGAQFCLGYGASADQMIALGSMRVVATIPDPNAANTSTASCIITGPPVSFSMFVPSGWSLLGNSLNQTLSVASLYGDANAVVTVWKWDTATLGWQFYTPTLDATALQAYAASKGFAVLSEIKPGEGYWVNAKAQPTLGTQSGASFITTSTNLAKGWNLVATGNDITPSVFESNLKASLPGTGVTSLWAWDNPAAKWYFFAPSLAAQSGSALSNYIAGKGYLDFGGKTLGNGTGFWVNR